MSDPLIIAAGNHVRGLLDSLGPLRKHALAIDVFGDRDTCSGIRGNISVPDVAQMACHVQQFSKRAQTAAFFWAGGTENLTEVLRETENSATAISLGSGSASIDRIRDPFLLGRVLSECGIEVLQLRRSPPATNGNNWLVKPFRSGGGHGISRYTTCRSRPHNEDFYFQEIAHGTSFGATFTAIDGRVRLHGVCQHLESTNPDVPFRYEGSVGPVDIDHRVREWLITVGNLLGAEFSLKGWFGIDFVHSSDNGNCRLLEVNPRFTFSMELIDRRWPGMLLRRHLEAFSGKVAGELLRILPHEGCAGLQDELRPAVFAARVLFNDSAHPFCLDNALAEWLWLSSRSDSRAVCDVPWPGTIHYPREPVCTVFSSGTSAFEAMTRLNEWGAHVLARIRSNSGSTGTFVHSSRPELGQSRNKRSGLN